MNAADRCGAGRARLIAGRRARRPLLVVGFFALALGAFRAAPLAAAPISVGPGETYVLTGDVALAPTDTFTAQGTEASPCTIVGAGFSVTAMDFKGTFAISHCLVRGLGSSTKLATDIRMLGAASFRVEDTTFSQSGQIYVLSNEDTGVSVLRSDFLEDAAVVVFKESLANSVPAIQVEGMSTTTKLFKGNRVLKSSLRLAKTQHWQVGGLTEEEGNIFYGTRSGIYAEDISDVRIQGNYMRMPAPWNGWNQMTTLQIDGQNNSDIIIEHNLLRGGNGILFGSYTGEVRYNVIADPHAAFWINAALGKLATKFHHNLLLRSEAAEPDANYWRMIGLEVQHVSTDMVETSTPQLEFYNNTMDAGDCYNPPGAGVSVPELEVIKSVRNNVFARMSYEAGFAVVASFSYANQVPDKPQKDPGPARMLYADYNAFANSHPQFPDNYGLSVAGKSERVDDGFGVHDLGNKDLKNQQADPMLTGPLPVVFPFSDDDLSTRAVTVCQVLAYYRKLYAPLEGKSPLIDAADPADGAGADIGAIGAGTPHPDDLFGTVCPADISALKPPSGDQLKCPMPTPVPQPGGGGTSMPSSAPGWLCVCTVAAAPRAGDLLPMIVLVAIALSRSRRRAHRR
jgi:hypothetical protein